MATLADINNTLQEQNKFLESVQENTDDNKKSVERLVERLTGINQKEKELEAQRKAKPKPQKPSGPSKLAQLGGITGIPGLAGIGGLIAGGGLISALFKGLGKVGKGGILALVGTALASAVGNYIESEGGDKELADAARRAIQVGSIASLFGFRFGLIGAAVAAILDEESIAKIKEIGETISGKLPYLGTLFEDMGIYVPTLSDVTQTVNDSLDGVIGLMEGDMTKFADNMGEIAQVIGTLLIIFGKGKFKILGAAVTGVGTAMDYAGEQFGVVGEALTGAVAGLLGAAYLFRNKIKNFLQKNKIEPKPDPKPDPKPKPKPTPIPDETSKKLPTQAEVAEERLKNRQPVKPPKGKTGIGSILDDLFKGGGKVAKIAGKGVLRFIPGVGWALLAADVAEAAGVPVYDTIGDFFNKAFSSGEEVKQPYDDAILRQLRGANTQEQPGIKVEVVPSSQAEYLNEAMKDYGMNNNAAPGPTLAPQVDARSTSIDQSQAALITTDQHVRSEDPRGALLYDY